VGGTEGKVSNGIGQDMQKECDEGNGGADEKWKQNILGWTFNGYTAEGHCF